MEDSDVAQAFWQGVFAVLIGPVEETRDGTIIWYLTWLVVAMGFALVAVLVAAAFLVLSWRGVDLKLPVWARSVYDWARGFFRSQ